MPCPNPDNEHTMTRRTKIVFFINFKLNLRIVNDD